MFKEFVAIEFKPIAWVRGRGENCTVVNALPVSKPASDATGANFKPGCKFQERAGRSEKSADSK